MFSHYNTQEDEATRPLFAKLNQTSTRQSKYQHFFSVYRNYSLAVKTITFILCGVCILSAVVAAIFLPRVSSSALSLCLADANIQFLVQGSVDWKRSIRQWNVRLTYTPAAVATPYTIEQIQVAVNCGINNRVRVTAKGGGHSFGSYGLGSEDGHLVIALQQLNKVTLFENGTARIQPGARLGHVSSELYKQGGRAIPHGACPGVGLAGHALHGGYGRASRTHGLTLDWMTGARVILADGSMVFCSTYENSELFWALRGAGSSFGIVAEFEFKTFDAPEYVTPFTIELHWNEQAAFDALSALQDFALVAPQTFNMFSFVTATSQVIQGLYFGDKVGLANGLQPLLARVDTTVSDMETVGWLEGHEYFADGEPLDSLAPYNAHGTFYTSSLTTPTLTRQQIKSVTAAMFRNINNTSARHSWEIFIEMHEVPNSAVSMVNSSATAYPHRDKVILWQLSDIGEHGSLPRESFEFLRPLMNRVTESLAPSQWGQYSNFIDTELDGEIAQDLYWEENLPRLKVIKPKFDPTNIFWNPQGVSPIIN
ncbi:hypothetical protein BKA59DRAFT_397348 [Fusarium tricinctum]|uniref:FAD-binding PCMH-type domain-containing protein n=1 Tax=Fusarium tricinctum TaxID=61284 RepID=A0A8K0RVI0_9HYPO|nr:hypothetical protein BKA59DRAFT_397348 [Fusarium tricinctum]